MDKRIYAVLAFLIVGGLGYYLLAPKCEQPDEMTVSLAQLECVMAIDVPTLRAEVCQKLYQIPDCQLNETDLPAVQEFLNDVVNSCVKNSLKTANFCTDKYEDIR